MAIITRDRKKYYYANVNKEGRMRLRSRQEDGTYSEKLVDGVAGVIVDIKKTEGDYEGTPIPRMEVSIMDGEEKYILSVSRYSTYGRGLINKLLNVNMNRVVEIGSFASQFNGKQYIHPSVKQGDKNVLKAIANEQMPEVKTVQVGKKEVIDSSERDDFFDSKLDQLIQDLAEKPAPTVMDVVEELEESDIPF
jgi:hypothetical protein